MVLFAVLPKVPLEEGRILMLSSGALSLMVKVLCLAIAPAEGVL
jgi:hypothetical protein